MGMHVTDKPPVITLISLFPTGVALGAAHLPTISHLPGRPATRSQSTDCHDPHLGIADHSAGSITCLAQLTGRLLVPSLSSPSSISSGPLRHVQALMLSPPQRSLKAHHCGVPPQRTQSHHIGVLTKLMWDGANISDFISLPSGLCIRTSSTLPFLVRTYARSLLVTNTKGGYKKRASLEIHSFLPSHKPFVLCF